ncbi:vacuole morphology and inheritance protein [Saccharata proteae CBS 121410]|uniref:Vacuole morphology and inheritance protein n=1 Tax=Saccharata proteae CBS 121410 TaxID=1314787 RepID=A0A9P4LR93_9PEZI|nr:vacuole morphology and inheritance protein [Saccharata proteae CBS 121410]
MDANIQKALNDKLYERRKGGALELEAQVRDALAANDHDRIQKIVSQLCSEYAYAIHQPHARNGGLIGLAAASIALGGEVARYLEEIVPPVLACFGDQDARVRYYACESMYNIAKVAKGEILLYFNEVFDALCKLAADSEMSVKNGAELLDRLVKDIVAESAASYVSILYHPEDVLDDADSTLGESANAPSINVPTAFSLSRFIPLLQERLNVINPFTRTFLVSWITLLDSIPDLELVSYLPSFLAGLFKFLSDVNQDVHTATQAALERFLSEIKKIARIKRGIAESRKSHADDGGKVPGSSIKSGRSAGSSPSMHADDESPHAADEDQAQSSGTSATDTTTINDEKSGYTDGDWIPGQDVQVNYEKILDILVTFLNGDSLGDEIQLTALRWIDSLFEICPEEILLFVPRLLSQVLPAMANDGDQVRQAANRVNNSLMEYIMSLPDEVKTDGPRVTQIQLSSTVGNAGKGSGDRRDSNMSSSLKKSSTREPAAESKTPESKSRNETRTPTPPGDPSPSPHQRAELDYDAAVNALTLQFLNEHEATRVAALSWLIMLHRKAPRKILAINDGTFPALLKTLSDPSETVVTRDLLLLSQISKNSDDSYFTSFMVSLLSLFATDRRLLETRGNLIIRQLCISLSAERIYRTLADCLEKDEDVEFASIMVQNLNNNLITAPELADLRKRLRNPETKDGQNFFTALFRAWCHNAVASFSLCLLAQAYEQAYHLLQIFGDLEMTVNMLIQIDKLVQLLESPVFTYLRLQLLEPEKYPQLYKCLYGLLMLLPQSSAFAALKNRLNSVSAIGYLHIAPRTAPTPASASGFESRNRLKSREENSIKWQELLEKFKQVQEKARRAQRIATFGADNAAENPSTGSTSASPTQEKKPPPRPIQRPNSAASVGRPIPSPAPVQGHQKSKSSLSQLGRFAGSVGARRQKK